MSTTRWEYKVEWGRPNDTPKFWNVLNEWGQDGWELVAVLAIGAPGDHCERFYFKRKVD